MSDQSSAETNSLLECADKRPLDDEATSEDLKRLKLSSSATPPSSETPSGLEHDDAEIDAKQKRKEEMQLKKQQQKEEQRLMKEKMREEERLEKQKRKEQERLEREQKKEQEKLEREKRKQEEKLAKERKKEQERLERERKKEQEKLERERKKEEERLERERKKEEERLERERKKEAEKQERDRKREEERLKKEEEKRKIEEAKERGQMKISNFFTINQKKASGSETNTAQLQSIEEGNPYRRMFLPFFQKQNTLMPQPIQLSPKELANSISRFDELLSSPVDSNAKSFFTSNNKGSPQPKITTPDQIIGALNSSVTTESEIYQMLQHIPPIKYLQFYENSKPPYIGTWCSCAHIKVKFPVDDPFNTALTGLDYEYDSDLDWNGEDEEGEDIDEDDEDDDDDMEEDDEEMEDFVEATDSKKKRKFLGPLIPVVQWNDGTNNDFFDSLQYERLHVDIKFPIDPDFNYWGTSKAVKTDDEAAAIITSSTATIAAAVKPTNTTPNVLTPQKPKITEPRAVLALIEFIEKNNDFTIGTLVELSKKEFQSYTKALIRHTIQDVAIYNKKTAHWEVKAQIKDGLVKSLQTT